MDDCHLAATTCVYTLVDLVSHSVSKFSQHVYVMSHNVLAAIIECIQYTYETEGNVYKEIHCAVLRRTFLNQSTFPLRRN